jgi:hypothetical protein
LLADDVVVTMVVPVVRMMVHIMTGVPAVVMDYPCLRNRWKGDGDEREDQDKLTHEGLDIDC